MNDLETPSSRIPTPDSDWRRFVRHFKKDLEYDYSMAVFSESDEKIVPTNKEYYRIKDQNLGIVFHPEKPNLREKIKFKQMKRKNSSKAKLRPETPAAVMLRWNKRTQILQASRECDDKVFCKSPLNTQEEEMQKNGNEEDWLDVLNFKEYYKKLVGENSSEINCDPCIELRFHGNIVVSIRSRAAACLYYTFI